MWWSLAMAVQPPGLDAVQLSDPSSDGLDPGLSVPTPSVPGDRDVLAPDAQIVGGRLVEPGEYPDAVGIVFYGAYVGCTGTLVAPNVVLSAAHCLDAAVTHVVVGASAWTDENVEVVEVLDYWSHPSYTGTGRGYDIGIIKLAEDSSFPHRVIADTCVIDAVTDGTPATMVGFGNTDIDGSGGTTLKNVADTLVVDADCSEDELNGYRSGCQEDLRPGGEIVAGGRLDVDGDGQRDGPRDVCFGDSGGPLYVHTRFGTHVMGVVSRAMAGVDQGYPCRDGSIWTRPDAVMDWLEETVGVDLESPSCNEPPTFEPDVIEVKAGKSERYKPDVVDVDSDDYELSVVAQGELGTAEVKGRRIVYTADRDAAGEDLIIVRVTDSGSFDGGAPASTDIAVSVAVVERGCGCQTGAPGLTWLGWLGLVVLGARRR